MPGISPRLPLVNSREDGGYVLNKTMKSSVSQNLKNLLLTNQGEKVFDASFGCGLKNILFEQFSSDAEEKAISRIADQVQRYMPYVTLGKIKFSRSEDENKIFLEINYSVNSLSISDTLGLDIIRSY
jgi:phage baseplate assembly protein W